MKKILWFLIVGVSMMYGEQVTHTVTNIEAHQTELEQIKKEIEQLKREQSEVKVLKHITSKNYALEEDIHNYLNEFYTNKGEYDDNRHYKSYILKNYRIVSYDIQARIQHINIETDVEWELLSNDKRLYGVSANLLQLMELDGKLSIVSVTETNEV